MIVRLGSAAGREIPSKFEFETEERENTNSDYQEGQQGQLPASNTSSCGGSSQRRDAECWDARSGFVDTWVSSQDFGRPRSPEDELLEQDLVVNHDDVIERGKSVALQYAQGRVNTKEVKDKDGPSLALTNDRTKEKVIESHITQRVDLEGNTSYTCTVCHRDFTHKSNLRYHATCAGEVVGSYPCELCQRVFKSTSHLTYHMRSVHTKERPFQCKLCEKSFHQSVKLKRHQLLHTGERPFQCDVCKKSFKTNYHLKEHRNIHTTDLHHPCSSCDKRFADKNNLRRHMKIFHSQQQLVCGVSGCKHEVFSKHEYDLHMREHRALEVFPFNCKVCQKGFKNKTDLERHESTHRSHKQHLCDVCHKSFARRDHLKRHKRLHTDNSPDQRHAETLREIGNEEEKVDEPSDMDWELSNTQPSLPQPPLLLPQSEPGYGKEILDVLHRQPSPHCQVGPEAKAIAEDVIIPEANSHHVLQIDSGGLRNLRETPPTPTTQVCRAKVRNEISDLLKGITKEELRALLEKIDSAERSALEQILQSSGYVDQDSEKMHQPPERPVATTNMKKNLLNRYRKQSGYDVGRQDLASASSLQLMPEMAVDVSQRAAAADSLARWLEQKKEIRLQQEERGGGNELQNNLGGTQCNNTVIKVTPKGLRKITLFEENFKQ